MFKSSWRDEFTLLYGKTKWQLVLLLVSGRHVGAHPDCNWIPVNRNLILGNRLTSAKREKWANNKHYPYAIDLLHRLKVYLRVILFKTECWILSHYL